jgi:hypothetical protein
MKTTIARLSIWSLLPAAGLLLAACAADTGDPAGEPGARAPEPGLALSHGHALTPMPDDRAGFAGGQSNAHMVYRGGPIISNVKVYTVFWGASVKNQSQLDAFYTTLVNSAYIDGLREYDTPTQSIGRGAFQSAYVDAKAPSGAQIDDTQVQQELARLIDGGALPQPDANTLFMVHFPAGVTISMQGSSSCQQFCAYHSSFAHGSGDVYYGILPDFSGRCSSCGGESTAFNGTTVVASHEVAEAITDPNIGVANSTQDEKQLAWYDDTYDEIGDVCQGQSFTFEGYRVTKLWSNRASACVADGESADAGGGGTGGGSTGTGTGGGSTGTGSGGSCSHPACQTGAPLDASCGTCTGQVCNYMPQCCTAEWDASCVQGVEYICGKHCQ